MAITFPGGDPGDVITIMRIGGKTLPASGKTTLSPGRPSTGWDVISPTIKPLSFAVAITADASGKKLLDRPDETTLDDGRGAGSDEIEV